MKANGDALGLSATDLSHFLACRHRIGLELAVAEGQLQRPRFADAHLETLFARGVEHERAYVSSLAASHARIVDLSGALDMRAAHEQTLDAMSRGADAIVQGALADGAWSGRPDVLVKVAAPSSLGASSYEVEDTKLARETRAGTILQLGLYCELLEIAQGVRPERFRVVTPHGPAHEFRVADFAAYFRWIREGLAVASGGGSQGLLAESDPEPCEHCDVCPWWSRCDAQWRRDDHLSLVAGITRLQRQELAKHGVVTLRALADLPVPLPFEPRRGAASSYERIQHQARLQRDSRGSVPLVEFLPPPDVAEGEVLRFGFARLPEPCPGDVFLDLEGDPFVESGGREYLLGWVALGADGLPAYTARWALNAAEEKAAFEQLIDTLLDSWQRHPSFAIYHFGAYEPAALKRLMGRHATREAELDRLLRGERFVDLLAVVRESLRIGVESYGLKPLEAVHGYARELDLRDASLHKNRFERALELGIPENIPEASREAVERYNRDDCLSTLHLRDWLEARRAERSAAGVEILRPVRGDGAPSEEQEERSAEIQALMDALLENVPAEPESRSAEQRARWTLAYLLEWHRREAKASWWDFYRIADLPPAQLRNEKNALVGLEFVQRFQEGKKLPIDRYRFPPQDHDVRPGRELHVSKDQRLGTVESVDLAARTIDIKKRGDAVDLHPQAVLAHEGVRARPIPEALERLANQVCADDVDGSGRFRAARDLLLGLPPRLRSTARGSLARPGETALEAAVRLALDLEQSVLPVQGPPGTGKTHTGARLVCALVHAGQKVGIAGPSHKVIRNFLEEVVEAAAEERRPIRILQRVRAEDEVPDDSPIETSTDSDCLAKALAAGTIDLAAGTVWAWAREDMEARVDTLIIDEAGQLSLANALAAATAARNLVLLGDPQQLEQPIQGSHPPGCDTSALEHLLGPHDTIPPDRGLFLATTWRLHPAICAFTSELFYENRLDHHPRCADQALTGPTPFAGAGLWLHLVDHQGNTSSSPEEVAHVAELVRSLVTPGIGWTDFKSEEHPLRHDDLRIVSPYNAQVAALRTAIPEAARQIGTVDRFQGQEAPVVLYSMTTSSTAEAPRGLEFLFSLNRLNVATSRARCVCIVVASPGLFEAECRTPRQMKLANALCRYRELAQVVRIAGGPRTTRGR